MVWISKMGKEVVNWVSFSVDVLELGFKYS